MSNREGRYESIRTETVDDGWTDEAPRGARRTTITHERTRKILARNDSPDIAFDRSINPYKGCEHGCVYCFARPTHAWLGLSPGLDFETRIVAKPDAAALLRRELARPGYRPETIALGANTDPYQPVERRLRITRAVLEVLAETRHPVGVVTKSDLVLRDLDLLAPMAAEGLACVSISLTTLDPELARRMEPRAPAPHLRLRTVERLAAAGIPVAVLTSPMIPGLNDHELERLLEAAASAGATSASYVLLRLPLELAALFEEWLAEHYPARRDRVLGLLRGTREGALYRSGFDARMRGSGPVADLLGRRFETALSRYGLRAGSPELDTTSFRPTARDGQLDLFAR